MNVELKNLEKSGNGWKLCLRVDKVFINPDALKKIKDWQVTVKENQIYFEIFIDNSEPWEDESIEEFIKSSILEVELKLKNFGLN